MTKSRERIPVLSFPDRKITYLGLYINQGIVPSSDVKNYNVGLEPTNGGERYIWKEIPFAAQTTFRWFPALIQLHILTINSEVSLVGRPPPAFFEPDMSSLPPRIFSTAEITYENRDRTL